LAKLIFQNLLQEDDFRETADIAAALDSNPAVDKTMRALEDGLRDLIQALEDQRRFVKQVPRKTLKMSNSSDSS
jgi:RecJ-like exonuclease